jgi:hypothetical protein
MPRHGTRDPGAHWRMRPSKGHSHECNRSHQRRRRASSRLSAAIRARSSAFSAEELIHRLPRYNASIVKHAMTSVVTSPPRGPAARRLDDPGRASRPGGSSSARRRGRQDHRSACGSPLAPGSFVSAHEHQTRCGRNDTGCGVTGSRHGGVALDRVCAQRSCCARISAVESADGRRSSLSVPVRAPRRATARRQRQCRRAMAATEQAARPRWRADTQYFTHAGPDLCVTVGTQQGQATCSPRKSASPAKTPESGSR